METGGMLLEEWYAAGASREFRARPVRRTVCGVPVVLFRSVLRRAPAGVAEGSLRDGRVVAFVDRCPHRNVPLSSGRVDGAGCLECPYHGWRFGADGRCVEIPGLVGVPPHEHRLVELAVREESGLVFVCPSPGVTPARVPHRPKGVDEQGRALPGYTAVVREVVFPAGVHATAENALDVPHTAVLHRGLFRGTGARTRIRALVQRYRDRTEAEYVGERAPRGLLGRLLAVGKDGTVEHHDRFYLPSTVEVEYRLGERTHFVITALLRPLDAETTVALAVASFRTPLPGALLALVLEPVARLVVRQDQRMLALQTKALRDFGGARYVSTAADVLGPNILRLMRAAERRERRLVADADTAFADGAESPRTEVLESTEKPGESAEEPLASYEVELDV